MCIDKKTIIHIKAQWKITDILNNTGQKQSSEEVQSVNLMATCSSSGKIIIEKKRAREF